MAPSSAHFVTCPAGELRVRWEAKGCQWPKGEGGGESASGPGDMGVVWATRKGAGSELVAGVGCVGGARGPIAPTQLPCGTSGDKDVFCFCLPSLACLLPLFGDYCRVMNVAGNSHTAQMRYGT